MLIFIPAVSASTTGSPNTIVSFTLPVSGTVIHVTKPSWCHYFHHHRRAFDRVVLRLQIAHTPRRAIVPGGDGRFQASSERVRRRLRLALLDCLSLGVSPFPNILHHEMTQIHPRIPDGTRSRSLQRTPNGPLELLVSAKPLAAVQLVSQAHDDAPKAVEIAVAPPARSRD